MDNDIKLIKIDLIYIANKIIILNNFFFICFIFNDQNIEF